MLGHGGADEDERADRGRDLAVARVLGRQMIVARVEFHAADDHLALQHEAFFVQVVVVRVDAAAWRHAQQECPFAALGVDAVDVYARPRVAILSTGNEIIPPGQPLVPGQIHDINSFTLRGDNYGGYRTSLDLNRPLFKNKLAVRLSGVYQSTGYERKPSADVTKRQQGTITYKPFGIGLTVTPTVLARPWHTMPSESPTKIVSTPAVSATAAKVAS